MKKSDLRKIISEYRELKQKQGKKNINNKRLVNKIKEIEHRYFHETGRALNSDL